MFRELACLRSPGSRGAPRSCPGRRSNRGEPAAAPNSLTLVPWPTHGPRYQRSLVGARFARACPPLAGSLRTAAPISRRIQ
jgi:hypothetical protein